MAKAGFGKVKIVLSVCSQTTSALSNIFQGSSLAEGPWSLTDHGKKAEKKVKENPYDLESWSVLVREAQVRKLKLVTVLCELIQQHLGSVNMIDNLTSCCLNW